jgi:hypothetical protein
MTMNKMTDSFFWQMFHNTTGGAATKLGQYIRRLLSTEFDPVFDDYLFSGLAIGQGVNAPDLEEFRDALFLFAFAGTGVQEEQGYFTLHILHGLAPGTNPTLHVHWSHNQSSPSGDVKWQVDYTIVPGYQTAAFPAPTTMSVVQTAGAQYTHHITDDDSMTVTDTIEPDSVMIGRIYRDQTDSEDTFEADAFLIHIDMHYERDRVGSISRNRPFEGF